MELDDTIAALASPAGPGARGVIRLSGPRVWETLNRLFDAERPDQWSTTRVASRHAGRLRLADFRSAVLLDVYLWPNSRSYTGQPAAELHMVGSPPLLESVLAELHNCGARPARPGEFTLRAFLAGRVDLVQAEAVLGVIDAHDHRELETALRQLAGGISGRIASVRNDLLDLLADLEAGLDFVDEDIEFVSRDQLLDRIDSARNVIELLLGQAAARMRSSGRRQVVLAGLPNAGKSTLFNALVGRDTALVSAVSGTTRDYLCAPSDWNGTAVELIDTAGWNDSLDAVTGQAQRLGWERLQQADLILWCNAVDFDPPTRQADARLRAELIEQQRPLLLVQTKCDVDPNHNGDVNGLQVSALAGTGMSELIKRAVAQLAAPSSGGRQLLGATASRCRDSLERALGTLKRGRESAATGAGDEILAIDLREALDHLGHILGTVYTDDILDRIFRKFCIGK